MAPRTPFDNDEDRGAPLDPKDRLLREAKERFKRAQDWEGGWRKLYIDVVKFANGDSDNGWQWPDDLRRDREVNKRPALTINKTSRLVAMITNDAELAVVREQFRLADSALESLRETVRPKSERTYRLMAESYIDMLQKLRAEIIDYLERCGCEFVPCPEYERDWQE